MCPYALGKTKQKPKPATNKISVRPLTTKKDKAMRSTKVYYAKSVNMLQLKLVTPVNTITKGV